MLFNKPVVFLKPLASTIPKEISWPLSSPIITECFLGDKINIERSLQVAGNTPFVFTVLGSQLSTAFETLPGYDSPKLSQQNALLP